MSKRPLPTLEDVAKQAKVSTATVSRCLNTPEVVAVKTRKRILATVEALGYFPNFGAKALASKRTHTVGAIIPTLASAIFARGLQAFQAALSEQGQTLLVASSYYDSAIEAQQIRAMVARGADGLLLIGQRRDEALYRVLTQKNVPYVTAWNYTPNSPHPMVGFDNAAATQALATLALSLGHRHIAYISAEQAHNDRADQRVKGVQRALLQHGMSAQSLCVLEAPYAIEPAGAAFETLMQRRPRPSLVMCGNDVQATGALKKAQQMGLCVPEDISITGFDDLELATVVTPELTTVHVPHREMGRRAAQVLLDAIEHAGGASQHIQLETSIVQRGSLGPPRSSSRA